MTNERATLETVTVHEAVETLIELGYIEETCSNYGEPGYKLDNPNGFLVFGNIWCKERDCTDDSCHSVEAHYPAEFAALEAAGAEFEWSDEWYVDSNADKAWRTQSDCYSWQSSITVTDGEILTPDDDLEDWVQAVVNNPRSCLPSHVGTVEQLAELGFVESECGFENGFHPGQTDDPKAIMKIIREGDPGAEVLFQLSGVGQFDVRFCVFVKAAEG